jgi:hypothetical protein
MRPWESCARAPGQGGQIRAAAARVGTGSNAGGMQRLDPGIEAGARDWPS